MKGRSSFPECCWMCFGVIREYRNRVEGFAEDSHACVCKTQDSKGAAMTPFCGRALADPKLQKVIFEQADPWGSLRGASGCHHPVFLDVFSGKLMLLFCWQYPLWVEKKPWKYVCVHLCVCPLITLLQSSLSWLQAGLCSCAQREKVLFGGSTKGTSQKEKYLQKDNT